jgi:hypothetical protein
MRGRYKADCVYAVAVAEKTRNPRRRLLAVCDFLFCGFLLAYLVVLTIYATQVTTAEKHVYYALVAAEDGFFALVDAYVGDVDMMINAAKSKFVSRSVRPTFARAHCAVMKVHELKIKN